MPAISKDKLIMEASKRYICNDEDRNNLTSTLKGLDIGSEYFRNLISVMNLDKKREIYKNAFKYEQVFLKEYGNNLKACQESKDRFNTLLKKLVKEGLNEKKEGYKMDKEIKEELEKPETITKLSNMSKADLLDKINRMSLEKIVDMIESGEPELFKEAVSLGLAYTQSKPIAITAQIGSEDLGLFDRYSKTIEIIGNKDALNS